MVPLCGHAVDHAPSPIPVRGALARTLTLWEAITIVWAARDMVFMFLSTVTPSAFPWTRFQAGQLLECRVLFLVADKP